MDRDETFDAGQVLEHIKNHRNMARRKRYHASRLDRFRAEIVALRRAGASLAEIRDWLRRCHRIKAARSTIARFLEKLPENNGGMP